MNELDIFTAALTLSNPRDRAAYLDRACTGNPELRRRLEELLAAYARTDNPLDRMSSEPATHTYARGKQSAGNTATFGEADVTANYPGKDEHIGAVLGGKYKLLERIGEGGMGTVWKAEQREPVKRLVAVKLIKDGKDSKAAI